MRWQRRLLGAVATWFLATVPALGQTAQDALKVVPERAAGFVIVGNLGELNNKIETLAKRLGVPLPFSPLEHIKGELGVDKGLNSKGSLLFVILMAKGEHVQPIPLLYVPVTATISRHRLALVRFAKHLLDGHSCSQHPGLSRHLTPILVLSQLDKSHAQDSAGVTHVFLS